MMDARYQEALDYLYSFIDYSRKRSDRYNADAFDLGRVRRLMECLGNPHTEYPLIHIAGTKGKGSVAAMISACLQAAGYRTGLYTSPHLERFTERIQIDGQEIPEDGVSDLVSEIKGPVASIPELTTYELVTALGFLHFAKETVDCAVVEVGLGGRLDATNVVTPLVSVITSISHDHTQILGESLAEIAGEKAGIIKPGVPVVLAPQTPEAEATVAAIARERDAPVIRIGSDWLFKGGGFDLGAQSVYIWRNKSNPGQSESAEAAPKEAIRVEIPLLGPHQIENAATAYAALQYAGERGLPSSQGDLVAGFANTRWPARFEVVSKSPWLIVDCAHNAHSAFKLRQTLELYFSDRPLTLIFGASEDKDIEGMLRELLPLARRVLFTQAVHPRAAEPEELLNRSPAIAGESSTVAPVAAAIETAVRESGPDDAIVVTGSTFVAGEARAAWSERMRSGSSLSRGALS